ncbi:MAG: YbdK family carboxylate-amine ligase [Candidatus Protistobacter heckmanni]|nr:YbdK family carboxylate-amine ligase [Candidatus Protistobacter heckmanni]
MPLEPFAASRPMTMGIELERQLVDPHDHDLRAAAPDLLRELEKKNSPYDVKPEMTMSMIEIATGIFEDHANALSQLQAIRDAMLAEADRLNVGIFGGGIHSFQKWREREIFDKARFNYLSELYGYLAKKFTIFGQHVHIGRPDPDTVLYLLHGLSRYIPHFITLSASSPFVQGADTGFQSARLNSVFAFPLSGRSPFVESWTDFERYFEKMTATGVVRGMKDFYWDIRPKPEYGTVEVRVMNTPLSVSRAAALAAYVQCVERHLMTERPFRPAEDDYLVYTFNRFQACRFGYRGIYVDPRGHEHRSLGGDILAMLDRVREHARDLGAQDACGFLRESVAVGLSEADSLRAFREAEKAFPAMVQFQCDS